MPDRRPLDGINIVDVSRLVPGAYCTMLLAHLGASVLKIEEPGAGDPLRALPIPFAMLNGNKKSATLNLRSAEGVRILKRLLKSAHVLVESFKPGVLKMVRLDYRNVRKVNPKIVYCSITGYGQTGPLKDQPGHDINFLAQAGALHGSTSIPNMLVADFCAGGLMAAFAIVSALKKGKGDHIDVSMSDGIRSFMMFPAALHRMGAADMISGTRARYGIYETSDGKHIAVGAVEEKFWAEICRILNLPLKATKSQVAAVIRTRTRREWAGLFARKRLPVSPVRTPEEATAISVRFPIEFASARSQKVVRAPKLGQHTVQVLRKMSYSKKEIEDLFEKGIC